ncbi:MAG: amidohydrolase family protein, partial [Acetobacteraceae bacterium]|nr:amidohydrolase family protein [Acetobacteraceae bacterium]
MIFTQSGQAQVRGRVLLPAGACDCHAHVYGPFDRFPLPAGAPFQPSPTPVEALERLWETFGVERGVLIQGSAYGQDHRALLAAIGRDPKNRRGVAVVEPATPEAALKHMHANGICGARVNFVRHLNPKGFDEAACREVVRRIEPLGWHLELHVDAADLARIQRFVRESPVEVVIDHMGRVDAALGPQQAPFRALLESATSSPRCWVKLSGADRLARQGALEAALSFAQSLLKAAPERVVWGTDWPHVNLKEPPSDEALFAFLAQVAP